MEPNERNNQNDHDLLVRIDEKIKGLGREIGELKSNLGEKVAVMEATKVSKEDMRMWMDDIKNDFKKTIDGFAVQKNDHEDRIRKLEKWVWTAIGALGIIQFLIAVFK